MKGKIDSDGFLNIIRNTNIGEAYIMQFCPHVQGNAPTGCGHWCPLFGEPEKFKFIKRIGDDPFDGVELKLCHTSLRFDEFTDEREGGNND